MRIIYFIKTLRLIYFIPLKPLYLLRLRGLKIGLKVIFDFKTLRPCLIKMVTAPAQMGCPYLLLLQILVHHPEVSA